MLPSRAAIAHYRASDQTFDKSLEALLEQHLVPDEIVVSRDRANLAWREEGGDHTLSAERLRLSCRCAWCTRDRLTDGFPAAFAGVTIANVAPIGGHGLHITFSDGHARGIFPFRYLREIASKEVAA